MFSEEILILIRKKELEITKLQGEVNSLKVKYNDLNSTKGHYTKEEKIKIFMDYFKGRDDVYP